MRAATLGGFGEPLTIVTIPRPKPARGQILIKLEASGVCHTDVHVWLGHASALKHPQPLILGHEGVGTVVSVGEDVSDWRVGQRAGAAWLHNTCGTCDECIEGEESFCQHQHAHGFSVNGTFAEYVVADARYAARLPVGDSKLLAPLMCAGLTAYGAIARSKLLSGETCAIFGCGGLGLYAVQLAVRAGAKVIAIDSDSEKLTLAAKMGAQTTLISNAQLEEQTFWDQQVRPHVCINFAPTDKTWNAMIAAIRPRGRIIAAAMVAKSVLLNQEWLTGSGVQITGTSVGTRKQMDELLAIHTENPLLCEIQEIGLEKTSAALKSLSEGKAKGRYCIVF